MISRKCKLERMMVASLGVAAVSALVMLTTGNVVVIAGAAVFAFAGLYAASRVATAMSKPAPLPPDYWRKMREDHDRETVRPMVPYRRPDHNGVVIKLFPDVPDDTDECCNR